MTTSCLGDQRAEDFESIVREVVIGLRKLQLLQKSYDEVGWRMKTPEFRKYRHIVIHLSQIVGRLSGYAEGWEHLAFDKGAGEEGVQISDSDDTIYFAIGDLIYHATQLATLIGRDVSLGFVDKINKNATRFAPESDFARIASIARNDNLA